MGLELKMGGRRSDLCLDLCDLKKITPHPHTSRLSEVSGMKMFMKWLF